MPNKSQHWQSRTPLRVRVLGLCLLVMVLALWGLLWQHWQQNEWLYVSVATFLFVCAAYEFWKKTQITSSYELWFDELSGQFNLLENQRHVSPIYIKRVWQSAFAITVQVQITHSKETRQLTFWRDTLSSSCWRKLHIYLWRYQLQYQLADLKGE